MARIPDEEIERLKREIPIERLVTGFGHRVEAARGGPDGALPVPRRPHAVADRDAGNESVALPGRVQHRRIDHRLGHEDAGRQLPPCRRAAAAPIILL